MQDPEPDKSTNWKPHRSVVAGAAVGTAIAQLVIAGLEFYFHTTLTSTIGGAITTLCLFTATYFIPD